MEKTRKKGQVTIFIILGVIIIIAVLIVLYINQSRVQPTTGRESLVETVKRCTQDSIEEGTILIGNQGGSINPTNYYPYQGHKVEYLCFIEENYKRCVVQKPVLKRSVELELTSFLQPRVEDCLEAVKESLEKRDFQVSMKKPEITVDIVPGNVIVNSEVDLVINKGKTETYKSIKTSIRSKLYDLVMIASSIMAWEARFGDSESLSYMMYYPDLRVEKKVHNK
jgi:hypothetical protein